MSGVAEGRAAVFIRSPQAVEVHQAGAWWAGELLGWRHDVDGSCQVRVRVTLAGVEETLWTDLAGLRLPERPLAVAPGPAVDADPAATHELPRASSTAQRQWPAPAELAATAGMPTVRQPSTVPAAPRSGGRRRAPEGVEAPVTGVAPVTEGSGGRRRAPVGSGVVVAAVAPAARPGGRRRALEAVEHVEMSDNTAAASLAGPHPAVLAVGAGRHRKADAGLVPAVTTGLTTVDRPPVPLATLDDSVGGRASGARTAGTDPQPEFLTRPMRLGDRIPLARRPRLDRSLTGA